jgi:hypothetical protein
MGQLPVELLRLRERYEQLVADASTGVLSREDAYALLSQLTVIDGSGAQWGLDDEGSFTCRRNPSEAPVVTNPGSFAPANMPMAQPAPQPMPAGSATSLPRAAEPSQLSIKDTPDFARHTSPDRESRIAPLLAAITSRPGPIAVASLILVALTLSAVTRGSRQEVVAVPATTLSATPTTPMPTTGDSAGVPVLVDVSRVVMALGTDPVTAGTVIVGGVVDPVQVVEWRSLQASGLLIKVLSTTPGTPVTQVWAGVDQYGMQSATFSVAWVLDAGVWKLQAWPAKS